MSLTPRFTWIAAAGGRLRAITAARFSVRLAAGVAADHETRPGDDAGRRAEAARRAARRDPPRRSGVPDDAAAPLDAVAAAPAVVIGRSYGGAVAIDLALRDPDRVRALVLLEGDALGLLPAALEWRVDTAHRWWEFGPRRGRTADCASSERP